jgi:outer membrane lipoprotein
MLLSLFAAAEGHPFTAGALKEVDRGVAFYDLELDPTAFVGKNVILGGTILVVSKRQTGTHLEIAELPLTSADQPDPGLESIGRFMVTSPDDLDRRVYKPGALITVIGTVRGQARVIVEDEEDIYPLVAVKEMQVWSGYKPPPVREKVYKIEPETTYVYEYPPSVYGPYYYPYYPWWLGWNIYLGGSYPYYGSYYGGHHHDHDGHPPPRGYRPPGGGHPPSGGRPPAGGTPPSGGRRPYGGSPPPRSR